MAYIVLFKCFVFSVFPLFVLVYVLLYYIVVCFILFFYVFLLILLFYLLRRTHCNNQMTYILLLDCVIAFLFL